MNNEGIVFVCFFVYLWYQGRLLKCPLLLASGDAPRFETFLS